MKYSEIIELTTKEIKEIIKEERFSYTKLKIAHAVSPLDNPMRLSDARKKIARLADLVRGKDLLEAQNILKFHRKRMYSIQLSKLIDSAYHNWRNKNEDEQVDENNLYIKTITVDNARQLKRIRPAPQGRAHRIRKRFNHITVSVDNKTDNNTETTIE